MSEQMSEEEIVAIFSNIGKEDVYILHKVGTKRNSMVFVGDAVKGTVSLQERLPNKVGVMVRGDRGYSDWLVTSPVLKAVRDGKDFKIETEGGFYELSFVDPIGPVS